MKSDPIELNLHYHGMARGALIVSENGDTSKLIYLPISQIEYELNHERTEVEITLPEWLAAEKELI